MPSIASVAAPSGVRLEISPATAFIDDELSIRILGLRPRETVTIRASTEDDDKRVWSSHAMFSADSSGIVDVTSQELSERHLSRRFADGLVLVDES